MKKHMAVCLVLALALCAACRAGTEEDDGALRLWFAVPEERQSREVTAPLGSMPYTGEETVSALLAALLAGPAQDSGLTGPIPAGTEVADWLVEGRTARVELSEEYAQLSGVDQTIADCCITMTLCQLPEVDRVELSCGTGDDWRVLRQGNVIFSGAEEEPVDVPASLYFRRTGSAALGFELRVFRLTEDETPAIAVLEALAAGPRDDGLEGLLPQDLAVRAAWVDDGVCYADVSSALLAAIPDSPEEQELVISSIVETLCSLDKVEQVQLLVEGEPLTAYGGLDLSGPLLPATPKDGFVGTPS